MRRAPFPHHTGHPKPERHEQKQIYQNISWMPPLAGGDRDLLATVNVAANEPTVVGEGHMRPDSDMRSHSEGASWPSAAVAEVKIQSSIGRKLDSILIEGILHRMRAPWLGDDSLIHSVRGIRQVDPHQDAEARTSDIDRWAVAHLHVLIRAVKAKTTTATFIDPVH